MNNLEIASQQVELARTSFESNVEELKLELNFKKEAAFALQILKGNDYLTKMSPESIKDAIINVSLTGITLNPVMKFAYLVPRKGKCILDISYMGLIKILTDTGSVKNIEAKIVYRNEVFEIQQGTNPYIKHGIAPTQEKGDIIGAYSIATLNDGSTSVEWMYYNDICDVAKRSESVKAGKNSPWMTDFSEMARKTVLKRHYKYLPKSERAIIAGTAIDIDHENNGIDFEKEKIEPAKEVKMVDGANPEIVKHYNEMLQAIFNDMVPVSILGGMNKEDFVNDFHSSMLAGTLPVELADKIYNKVLECFQAKR